MFSYTVRCTFDSIDRIDVSARWLEWLTSEHVQDVMEGGAVGAEIFQMDRTDDFLTFEIRYRFANRQAFEDYESKHAPKLRDEGLSRFPLKLGLTYERTVGELLSSFSQ